MHIATGMLSPPVWGAMAAVSGAALAGSLALAKKRLDDRRIPLMGVMGAFVFAAQMVNFPILGGTSGHLGGGFLLGVLLDAPLGVIVMSSILVVQAMFGDGGIEALGANIFVMGVFPCILGGLARRLWAGRRVVGLAEAVSVIASFAGVVGGSAAVAYMLWWSHAIPGGATLAHALAVMTGIHVPIGLVEGAVSVAVIRFVLSVRPEAVWGDAAARPGEISA
jgi:cobalt/nickel transport system permease protein